MEQSIHRNFTVNLTEGASEGFYRSIVEDLSEIIVRFDTIGTITYVNPAYDRYIGSRLSGMEPGKMVGQRIWDIMQAKNYAEIEAFLYQLAGSRQTAIMERSFIDRDGDICWVAWKIRALFNENDELDGYQAIGEIITERKENELELQAACERMESALERLTRTEHELGIRYRQLQEQERMIAGWVHFYEVVLAASGQVTYDYHVPTGNIQWSPTALDILGYTPDELGGGLEQWISLLHPDDRQNTVETLARAETARDFCILEYRIRHKNGTYVSVRDRGYFIPDEKRGGIHQVGVVQDITRLIHAEAEREHLKGLLSNIINSMPSIIVAVDTNGLVTQWNAEAARQIGLSSEQAQGRPLAEVLPQFSLMMQNLNLDFHTLNREHRHRATTIINGTPQYYSIIIYPLFTNQIDGAVIRIDNITDSVLMQELLVQNEKIIALGGMAAGMAHEINNPLSGILQAAQNMEKRLSPDLPRNREIAAKCGISMEQINSYMQTRQIHDFLSGIRDSGARAAATVSNMLQFSRRSEGNKQEVSLEELLEHSIKLACNYFNIQTGLDFRQIEILRQYDPGLKTVYCSANEIEQVMLNLFKNASHAMLENFSHSPAEKRYIILRTRRDGDNAVIEVEDNGPGMNPEVQKRIFEPFFSTKPGGMGTGLGMSISRFIITEKHQGQMTIQSEPGRGTCVTISLPLH